jgi:RNA-binding protein YlmH
LNKSGSPFLEWGGYVDAERKRIYVLPEYMEGTEDVSAFDEYGFDDGVAAVSITGSGYKKLSHRDFLGSILGLGLQRSVVGDIIMLDDGNIPMAAVICDRNAARFLCDTMTKVGTDTVTVRQMALSDISVPEKKFAHINDTLASPRADCVVAALCSLSREKARVAVVNGLLEVEHECCEQPDRTITAPCVVSVRGYGKFRINSLADKTKKGRLRLDADKYI